jgi:hypothetical protein
MRDKTILDANPVTEQLLVGAAPQDPEQVAHLLTLGATHVLDCRTRRSPLPPAATSRSLVWRCVPSTDDGTSRGVAWYAACIAFADQALCERTSKLYCHCAAGVHRAPVAVYAILRARGLTAIDARAQVLEGRPQARPRYFDDADRCLSELGITGRVR